MGVLVDVSCDGSSLRGIGSWAGGSRVEALGEMDDDVASVRTLAC